MSRCAVVAALFLIVSCVSCSADRVTVDPNAGRVDQARPADTTADPGSYDPASDSDTRMATEVSYEGFGVRLSTVVSAIARQAGVSVSCGSSKNDWRTRDFPVTLRVKDVPVGTVLRGLAHAAHCVLVSQPGDNGRLYSIRQDPDVFSSLDERWGATENHARDMARWYWETTARLKDVPDSAANVKGYEYGGAEYAATNLGLFKRLSAALAALGPDYMNRVLACGGFEVSSENAPAAASDAIRELMRQVRSGMAGLAATAEPSDLSRDTARRRRRSRPRRVGGVAIGQR